MNLAASNPQSLDALSWHILLEAQADGQVVAWVAEWPECRVVAESREVAIVRLETMLEERMQNMKVVSLAVKPHQMAENPIAKFAGIFKDDPDFAEIVAEMRAERELDEANPAYTVS
jgi:predicted RNase H-like HicB family nuclease